MDYNNLEWPCMVCYETRPDKFISVFSKDVSVTNGLPEGIMQANIRYCNDKNSCIDGAKLHELLPVIKT